MSFALLWSNGQTDERKFKFSPPSCIHLNYMHVRIPHVPENVQLESFHRDVLTTFIKIFFISSLYIYD
jgi:hypothetical protein